MEKFYPDEYLDSTYEIDFDQLYAKGYRGVIFDIDNTLVRHGAPADERACALFAHLKELGFSCMLLSNNKEPRVKMFNDAVNVSYIYKAGKPNPANYKKAMEELGTDTGNTIFVGDQIFTDVYGAKRAGIRSILVKPIHPKEEIQTLSGKNRAVFLQKGSGKEKQSKTIDCMFLGKFIVWNKMFL